jgi:hypothetical protein
MTISTTSFFRVKPGVTIPLYSEIYNKFVEDLDEKGVFQFNDNSRLNISARFKEGAFGTFILRRQIEEEEIVDIGPNLLEVGKIYKYWSPKVGRKGVEGITDSLPIFDNLNNAICGLEDASQEFVWLEPKEMFLVLESRTPSIKGISLGQFVKIALCHSKQIYWLDNPHKVPCFLAMTELTNEET